MKNSSRNRRLLIANSLGSPNHFRPQLVEQQLRLCHDEWTDNKQHFESDWFVDSTRLCAPYPSTACRTDLSCASRRQPSLHPNTNLISYQLSLHDWWKRSQELWTRSETNFSKCDTAGKSLALAHTVTAYISPAQTRHAPWPCSVLQPTNDTRSCRFSWYRTLNPVKPRPTSTPVFLNCIGGFRIPSSFRW